MKIPKQVKLSAATRSMAGGWNDIYRGRPNYPRSRYDETLDVLVQTEIAYRVAMACDPGWRTWAERPFGRLLDAAATARDRERSAKEGKGRIHGRRSRRRIVLSAGDILLCRAHGGTGHRGVASRRAAIRLIASLCTDERRRTALGVFLQIACPDVHDEAGIVITRGDLVPALTDPDPEIRERAMRAAATLIE